MYHVKSCNGYRTFYSSNSIDDVVRVATSQFDGDYDNVIMDSEGRIVGNGVEGYHGRIRSESYDESAGSVLTGREF